MSQSLVVYETKVDVRVELFTGDTAVHWLVTVVVVTGGQKLLAKVLGRSICVREPGEAP